jgi:hypothetical protein
MAALSERARSICASYWNPPKTRCKGCPIQSACESGTGTLTEKSLDEWRDRVSAAAEAVES